MEEMEDPTEKLKEIQEEVLENERKEKWTLHVALSTAVVAVLAAIAGLLSGHHANEAMIEQIKAGNQWSYYQAKSIKSELAVSTAQLMVAVGKPAAGDQEAKQVRYEKEKEEIKKEAEQCEKNAEGHLRQHTILAKSVTIFQIAIAIAAISILARKKRLWHVCLLLSAVACGFLILGII